MGDIMIFFDVDGTLMNNKEHTISPSTIYALHKLKNNGYLVGIATGRGVQSLQTTGVGTVIDWDGYVCNNGQTILNKDYQIIEKETLPPTTVKQTIHLAKELQIPLVLKMENRIITQEPDENVYESTRFFNNQIPPVGTYQGEDVEAMIAYGPKGYDYEPFTNIDGVHVMPGESTYCDITIAGVSKATAILKLLKIFNIDTYIAFGDSLNDIEMFKYADFSIAMGQGNEYTKEMADYVTTSIYEDGIYNACVQLGYIDTK